MDDAEIDGDIGYLLPALISSSGSSYLGPGSQGIHRVNRDDDGIGNHNQGGNQDRDGNSDGADNCSKGYNPPQTDTDEAGAGTTLLSDMVATADRSALGDRRRVDAFGSWPGCKPRAPISFAAMQLLKGACRTVPYFSILSGTACFTDVNSVAWLWGA